MATSVCIEEALAWGEYLDATSEAHGLSYEKVEPWAWRRLRRRLIGVRREREKAQREPSDAPGQNP